VTLRQAGFGEVGDDAIEVAEAAVVELDLHGQRLAEHLGHRDVGVDGKQGQVVAIRRS
jgi:hypothetical protein